MKNLVTFLLLANERADNTNKGIDIPTPNAIKLKKLDVNEVIVSALEKRAAIKSGLHGIIIAPKKKPNRNALNLGFLDVGVWKLGKNLLSSILNINIKLISPRIPNAIGDTIPITFVREDCRIVVNTSPRIIINEITPVETKIPSFNIWCLSSFSPN